MTTEQSPGELKPRPKWLLTLFFSFCSLKILQTFGHEHIQLMTNDFSYLVNSRNFWILTPDSLFPLRSKIQLNVFLLRSKNEGSLAGLLAPTLRVLVKYHHSHQWVGLGYDPHKWTWVLVSGAYFGNQTLMLRVSGLAKSDHLSWERKW